MNRKAEKRFSFELLTTVHGRTLACTENPRVGSAIPPDHHLTPWTDWSCLLLESRKAGCISEVADCNSFQRDI
jgi:hypothetical protein